ncbi:hypothetical protein ACTZWW_22520 [Salinarimonas sp. NSM]|uniref:hypothetical protein n=1 Tax=Salinarimonas sp. NSM TaxID=3458003 RepID=UPI0040372D5F
MSVFARPAGLIGLVAGFLVWSSAFLVLYGLHALGCAWGWEARAVGPTSALRLVLVLAWALHVALLAALALAARRGLPPKGLTGEGEDRTPALVAGATLVLTLAALVATLWTGLPVVAYPLCT